MEFETCSDKPTLVVNATTVLKKKPSEQVSVDLKTIFKLSHTHKFCEGHKYIISRDKKGKRRINSKKIEVKGSVLTIKPVALAQTFYVKMISLKSLFEESYEFTLETPNDPCELEKFTHFWTKKSGENHPNLGTLDDKSIVLVFERP